MATTTPSPLAILSNTTPRGSSIALSSLQALPETQLVLVLLDHPTIRRKWRAVVVPLIESISKRLNTLYPGSRLTIASIVYRPSLDKSLLRPAWTLSRTSLQPGTKLIASNLHAPEPWLGPDQSSSSSSLAAISASDLDPAASAFASIDGRSTARPTAHILEAFVAALEALQPSESGIHNPLLPKKPPVLARHMLHVCLDSTDVALDLSSPPFFNADAANDRINAPSVGAKLARLGVSITSCAVKTDSAAAATPSTSKEALAAILGFHKSVSEPNKLANEDLVALLPEAVRAKIFSDANIISTGLTPSSAQRAAASTLPSSTAPLSAKRGRDDEADSTPTPVKRSKSGSISQPQPTSSATAATSASTAPGASAAELPRNIKLDPSVSTKVLFLRSQQEAMIKNWAAAYATVTKAESTGEPASPTKAPGMNKAYLEQLKAQLMTQQQALKMLVHRIISGAETVPNFNVCLQSLINIDKEARDMGVILGGPSGGGAGLGRPGRSSSITGGQPGLAQQPLQAAQPAAKTAMPAALPLQGPAAADPTATAAVAAAPAAAPPASPTRPKPFWRGALTWSVISDPATKQKRDVATLVSATSNSSALDRLMMPWPDKLQITAITQLAPRNLQVYAQSQNAPYILFATQEAGPQDSLGGTAGPVLTAATAERNRQMYANLASSLDAKKSCAFVRHGSSPGAGLVLFATTQPTSSAEKNAKTPVPPKLIGVVLKDTIPFSRLLSSQASASQMPQTGPAIQPNQQQAQAAAAGGASKGQTPQVQARSRGASASGSVPAAMPAAAPSNEVSAANQPAAQQAQNGMGLGSSMPFNLSALNATGNVPVSGIGPMPGLGAGMGIGSNPAALPWLHSLKRATPTPPITCRSSPGLATWATWATWVTWATLLASATLG